MLTNLSLTILLLSIGLFLSACRPTINSSIPIVAEKIQISPSATIVDQTNTPFKPVVLPSKTPTQTPTITLTPTLTTTPFDLNLFETKILLRNVKPQTYVSDQCNYLSNRWGNSKSVPGTIVVPIMYHSVRQPGKPVTDPLTVSHEYFEETMKHAKDLGFETITSQELADFLYNNAVIPKLSMILIIDDRRPGVVRDHFLPVLEQNDWTVTLAYISGIADEREWNEMRELNSTNRLDMQAHGFLHNGSTYFTEFTSEEIIKNEIYNPIKAIEKNFGKRPIAFIWPGGNFTIESLRIVREAEYQIGFTAYSRGPIMFNWIPLGEQEIEMDDPLMLLPRYWSTTAYINLDEAVTISNQAIIFAEQNQKMEFNWYQYFCQGYPEIQSKPDQREN
ncbi:MAG: hypothetical protein CVU46_04805 [Chloroflexi bacterium HGW-Chloroflexi-8]|nr:MAG: hypothetical protein CVU46_04805 [Chloroflexi bacterium HGW-Chloroflexi-8]